MNTWRGKSISHLRDCGDVPVTHLLDGVFAAPADVLIHAAGDEARSA
jgi:hypothetical protein